MTADFRTLQERLEGLPEGRCLAGFSGGADSTALLMLLAAERESGRILPEAVHVNHGLRGAESDEDEAFCRKICNELSIPLHTERAELHGKKDEDSCRKERFRCFRKVMDETGIRSLVLAHNRDDLTETFLMRLLRGAGTEGLACMSSTDQYETFTIFRPMLKISRNEIRDVLRRNGISWREDSLNESSAYLRNRIRMQLIPMLEELSSGASVRIAQTAGILSGENRILQDLTDSFLEEHTDGRILETRTLGMQPEALRSRILRTWWKRNAPERGERSLNARQTAELAALTDAERGKVNLPCGLYAVKTGERIYLTGFQQEKPEEMTLEPDNPGKFVFGSVILEIKPTEGNPGNGITEQEVPAGFFRGCIIRTRKDGDRIRPFGMDGSRKLQDFLTDRGIDEPLRDAVPLICRGSEVLFAAGVGAGAVPHWNAGEKNIRIKWSGRMPWRLNARKGTQNGSEF